MAVKWAFEGAVGGFLGQLLFFFSNFNICNHAVRERSKGDNAAAASGGGKGNNAAASCIVVYSAIGEELHCGICALYGGSWCGAVVFLCW